MTDAERCSNHTFDLADHYCGLCGRPYCEKCLVTPFKRRASLCTPCAMAAAGIRSSAKLPPVRSKREIRQLEKAQKRARQEEAQRAVASPTGAPTGPLFSRITFVETSPGPKPTPTAPDPTPEAAAPAAPASTGAPTDPETSTPAQRLAARVADSTYSGVR